MTQARALLGVISPGVGRRYPSRLILRVHGLPKSTFYERQAVKRGAPITTSRGKRGPKTEHSDDELVTAIRQVITASPFSGEGHRKIRARLALRGIMVGKNRVLRLQRLHSLLAPTRRRHEGVRREHDGKIITERPNLCWGGDITEAMTTEDGKVSIFDIIDHCTDEIIGFTVTTEANRFAALDSLHQAVHKEFGSVAKDIARGVLLRVDHGSQFTSRRYVNEARYLGCEPSFSFVGQPQCNGVIERWHRTLKEQLLWTRTWKNAEEVRQAVSKFVRLYNSCWLVERHGYRSPAQVRAAFATQEAA